MLHESKIEKNFIDILTKRENQWTFRDDIKSEAALWDNLRGHINRINTAQLDGLELTDNEFQQVKNEFRSLTQTPFLASQWLRGENGIAQIAIEREDLTNGKATLKLFNNRETFGDSSYEVVSQIVPVADGRTIRGDVTLLINGLPLIHVELKSELAKDGYWQAFNQIERYAQTGFFDGIYAAVQLFVVSNKVSTKYFARPMVNDNFNSAKKFLFNWREPDNAPVEDLYEFTRKVLSIPMAHELISRYTILVDDKKSQKYTMVLRSYQIHAIKKITEQARNHEGGFIWHATGSGKTITSFVATKVLAQSETAVSRTVMIVDRKDLDNKTKNDFAKFASEYNTGQVSGDVTANTLIVGTGNRSELVRSLLSKKNNNTIIITTIQKLSHAIRDMRDTDNNRFEKLKGEHIVFIVDECHRAVSDEEMKGIKKYFPNSTWFGLTGTPIFEENKKSEKGTYARTTSDQYGIGKDGKTLPVGGLLHAYTTKNAMDDKSVLDFQVEYHSLLDEEEEKRYCIAKIKEKDPNCNDPVKKLEAMDIYECETLLDKELYESQEHIVTMLKKIFRLSSVLEKFKVVNGLPTMSGILTTHSIAQAKRIYKILKELKQTGELITGKPLDEKRTLNDPDFPRVAITYSIAENQEGQDVANEEITEIMNDYNDTFGTNYSDVDLYNQNINNRLERKDAQYQKDGQWLDLVIVVDRLLTGFDAPTIQTLYVDKELRYQGLLQAFSRTNRLYPDKKIGMVVTFRKPHTMRKNVENAIKLFSNEARDWEQLVPREYKEVKKSFKSAYKKFEQAKAELESDSNDFKKQIAVIKAFQTMVHTAEAIKSYEDFAEDIIEFTPVLETIKAEVGHIENIKGEVKKILNEQEIGNEEQEELLGIEFSANQKPIEETIDSFYITQLLRDIKKPENKEKLTLIIESKPEIVRQAYDDVLNNLDESEAVESVERHFKSLIAEIIEETADKLKVPVKDLHTSFDEYKTANDEVPYINEIVNHSTFTVNDFESAFGEKYRNRRKVIENYWRDVIESKLLPLKAEITG